MRRLRLLASPPEVEYARGDDVDGVAEVRRLESDGGGGSGEAAVSMGDSGEAAVSMGEVLRNPRYEVFSSLVTLASCLIFAVSTLDLPEEILGRLDAIEFGVTIFFAVEYLLRWIDRRLDPKFVFEFLSVVDFVSLLPTLLAGSTGVPSSLSVLRLLRSLRFQRLLVDVETFGRFRAALGIENLSSGDRMQDATLLQLARVLTSLFTLLFVASGLIYAAESDVNSSNFPDYFTTLYFGLTTLTTVGFGDIVPVTPVGRAVVGASIFVGIAVIPVQLTSLAETVLKTQKAKDARAMAQPRGMRLDQLKRACVNCGEKAHRKDADFCFRCGFTLPPPGGDVQ